MIVDLIPDTLMIFMFVSTACQPSDFASIKHDGLTEIASPRPTGPTCSPVLALTLTAVSPTRSSRARLRADGLLVRAELGLLGVDDHVAIDGPPPDLLDPVDDLRQKPGAVQPTPLRIGVRVMLADIAQAGRPQERIGHRVADHVGVGMPDQAARVLDPEPSQDQRPPLAQSMRVVPDPDPHVAKLRHPPTGDRLPADHTSQSASAES